MPDIAQRAALSLIAACALGSVAYADAPTSQEFALYKFQNKIGVERALDDGRELRTVFSFTDRTSPVPMASVLERGKDGTPVKFQLWGNTSRIFSVDDRVVAAGGKLAITQHGQTRSVAAPAQFFVGSAYAPVAITQELVRYWAAHGKPAKLPVFPIGDIAIERRGEDVVADRDRAPHTLQRYAITGIGWGKTTVWLDEKQQLAALKGVDTEFDHFEATGRGFEEALPIFVARAAEDGLAALAETSRALQVDAGEGVVAYTHARLIDGAAPVADATVVTERGKIIAVGPKVAVPAGARVIDATGATLVPGLWDMHAHFEQVEWGPVYLAAGVTTVRDCGNELDFIRAVRDTIDAGKGVGPRIVMACIVDGEGAGAIGVDRLRTPDGIPALIQKFKTAGCAQVKLYQSIDPKLIPAISKAAHAAGMTVTGHVPNGTNAIKAVEAGMDMISHSQFMLVAFTAPDLKPNEPQSKVLRAFESFDPASPATKKLAAWFAAHKTVIDPTLALRELFLPRKELAKVEPGLATLPPTLAAAFADPNDGPDAANRRMILDKALALIGVLHKAGVPIVAGTDQAVPGHSLHRELELYVQAGFTPLEAIRAATIVPARAMRRDKELGTIEVGKRADFVLVDGDPLADIRALRKVRVVVTGGKAYDPAKLWRSVGFALPKL